MKISWWQIPLSDSMIEALPTFREQQQRRKHLLHSEQAEHRPYSWSHTSHGLHTPTSGTMQCMGSITPLVEPYNAWAPHHLCIDDPMYGPSIHCTSLPAMMHYRVLPLAWRLGFKFSKNSITRVVSGTAMAISPVHHKGPE